jgi:bifunctional pyridoxal-dependent enzyme with beta-cystathionase and maltose regulon repressor activities
VNNNENRQIGQIALVLFEEGMLHYDELEKYILNDYYYCLIKKLDMSVIIDEIFNRLMFYWGKLTEVKDIEKNKSKVYFNVEDVSKELNLTPRTICIYKRENKILSNKYRISNFNVSYKIAEQGINKLKEKNGIYFEI